MEAFVGRRVLRRVQAGAGAMITSRHERERAQGVTVPI
jgi:hypothetical protein